MFIFLDSEILKKYALQANKLINIIYKIENRQKA